MAMDDDGSVDHYAVLGLPTSQEGSAITLKDIEKAYKLKARALHPDKRREDPTATEDFQKLVSSYEILKDPAARKAFDVLLAARRERVARESRLDAKRRKLAADLEERERNAGEVVDDPAERARREEKEASARLKVELERIRRMMRERKGGGGVGVGRGEESKETRGGGEGGGGEGGMLDKEKVLKVSWDREGGDYSAESLRELFCKFGEVEDVVIRTKESKKKRTALVVMTSRDAVVAATQNMCGNLSNPLLVLPLQPPSTNFSAAMSSEPPASNFSNILGAGYQAYEDSVLMKLQKAAEKQKNSNAS